MSFIICMKNFLTYLMLFAIIAAVCFFFWDRIPDFGKLLGVIAMLVSGFFAIRSFLSEVLGFVFSHFSSLFTTVVAVVSTAIIGLMIPKFFSTPQISGNTDPLSSAIAEISTSTASMENTTPSLISPNTTSSQSIEQPDQATNTQANDPKKEGSIPSIIPLEKTKTNEVIVSKQEILAILESNKNIGEQERKYWQESLDGLSNAQLIELKNVISPEKEENSQNTAATPAAPEAPQNTLAEGKSPFQTTSAPIAGATPTIIPAGSTNSATTSAPTPVLSYGDESQNNWKKPVIIAEDTSVIPENNPTAPILTSSGISDEKFIIPMEKENAQVVFPKEYSISSVVWTSQADAIESVSFAVITPANQRAFVTITLKNNGSQFNALAEKFAKSLKTENRFIITERTSKKLTYTSFFAGIMWNISISLPFGTNPSDEDFYSVLLPMVFEAKK